MPKKKVKIELYAEAPYIQGYNLARTGEDFFNPYADVADADDYHRGYNNAVEELMQ